VIDSESSDESESDYAEKIEGLHHKHPMARVFALGKINRAL
jgi:hypothetical protein